MNDRTTPVTGPAEPFVRVRAQAGFETRTLLSNGEQLLVSLILPALALVGMIHTDVPDLGAGDRIDIAAPGVLALAVVSTAFTGQAIATAFDRRYGLLRLLGVTPLGSRGLLGGKGLAVLVVIAVQVVVLGALALALGWGPAWSGVPAALLLIVLGTWAFVALALVLAGVLRSEAVLALANLIWVVLVIGGGLVMPTARMGDTLGTVVSWLPSGALGDGLRQALTGGGLGLHPTLVLGLWALVLSALASRFFRWSA